MKKIEDILARCLDDIGAGRASLDDCLSRYPDMRRELEPLLELALNIQKPPDVRPSDNFRIQARVNLMESIHAGKKNPAVRGSGRRLFAKGWLRTLAIVIAAILILSGMGTGTAYASQDSLPGETLYPVKLGTEQVQQVFTIDDEESVALEMKFAGVRLAEMAALAESRPADTATALTGYQRNLNQALTQAEQLADVTVRARVMETIALATSNHLYLLEGLEDTSPETAREAISNTQDIACNGHVRALQTLAEENPLKATEINLETISGQLNMASTRAAQDDIEGAVAALNRFEILNRLNQEIHQTALNLGKDTAAIEQMNTQASASHQAILNGMSASASPEIKAAVERSLHASQGGNGQETSGQPGGNGADSGPATPEPADNGPDGVQGQSGTPGSGKSGN